MGWVDSYATLLELFPQVDARLIKGAALEHGNDVAAAAEFILNEVIESDEGNLSKEEAPGSLHPLSDGRDAATGGSTRMFTEPFGEGVSGFANFASQFSSTEFPSLSSKDRSARPTEFPELARGDALREDKRKSGFFLPGKKVAPCDPSTSSGSLTQEEDPATSKDDKLPSHVNLVQSLPEFCAGTSGPPSGPSELEGGLGLESGVDQSTAQVQEEQILDTEEAEALELAFAGYHEGYNEEFLMGEEFPHHDDSISVPISAFDEDDGLDSMLSIQKSAISEEMDRASWENVNNASAIQLNQMDPLGNLVEEAKADKEALITSIEEIRVLRLMTDQAEFAARQSRGEAALGGADVMAKVEEMRKMLSRAREANAVHAGEVFGEKAVLATEARELQYRLGQVKSEKAKAAAALNEIKASLQARIESAVREREAAEQEKVTKEVLAKQALAKEEALVAKVAQESRELEAEAEACSKIRDFLVERGSIVDALQGEVAVLREDAEALKKDLESMSLSYSGSAFPTHVLSQPGSQIYNSIVSQSGKLSRGQSSDNLAPAEDGATSTVNNPGSPTLRSLLGVQKTPGDRKSWSSLPSLLRGLSGSQDLSGSAHSAYGSSGSNSLSSSRDTLIVNQGEKSQVLGSENQMVDIDPPSPHSPASPAGAEEERELLKAKMAMFPGEELDMEFSGVHNLDVFRAGNSNGSEDDDWQLLEKGSSRSSSRSSVGK